MHFPRLPDWLIYASITAALVIGAIGRQERADLPPPPPPVPGESGVPLGPASPFDAEVVVQVPAGSGSTTGTAFSISENGTWLTARHVVEGCTKAAIVVAEGRGVSASIHIEPHGDVAVLTTAGGAPALPMGLTEPLHRGQRSYQPGFPQGGPGEATARLLGRETLFVKGRGARREPVLVWAEAGRTMGLNGSLSGLSGAPVLDGSGRVIGLTVAEAPRRGRIYSTAPETLRTTLAEPRASLSGFAMGETITAENYGRVSDTLRRDLRVAQVVCIRG